MQIKRYSLNDTLVQTQTLLLNQLLLGYNVSIKYRNHFNANAFAVI
jgi:hypothetical protein